MPERLDVPPELASLIEKREQEDRRTESNVANAPKGEERRQAPDRRENEEIDEDESA